MGKKIILYIIFFVVLIAAFFIAISYLNPTLKKEVDLPILSRVKPFTFIDQDGHAFTQQDIQGKVCVVEFFFTTCHGICPRMNANMQTIATTFTHEPNFIILSHTVDPETDTAARLKIYADSIKANTRYWKFLTGSKEKLYEAARNSYILDDIKNNIGSVEEQFIHTQFFALVDKEGQVRGIYDGLKASELQKLKQDIKALLAQKIHTTTFVNNLYSNNPR
ncbi:MAG TPA: SCO family protein [Chitinophagaceae bacterium]|nr:SCO family protein [Chitinophagaceae bacterium]